MLNYHKYNIIPIKYNNNTDCKAGRNIIVTNCKLLILILVLLYNIDEQMMMAG